MLSCRKRFVFSIGCCFLFFRRNFHPLVCLAACDLKRFISFHAIRFVSRFGSGTLSCSSPIFIGVLPLLTRSRFPLRETTKKHDVLYILPEFEPPNFRQLGRRCHQLDRRGAVGYAPIIFRTRHFIIYYRHVLQASSV